MRIGVDILGSDTAPAELFEGVLEASRHLDDGEALVVYALETDLQNLIALRDQAEVEPSRVLISTAANAIVMDDPPLQAIRQKRQSSLMLGMRALADRNLDAFISAGNTGALVAAATVVLDKLPGIRRPALLTVLPSETGGVAVLDVGGYVDAQASHLIQFARMGAAFQRVNRGIDRPTVGLLNIGTESLKGTSSVREAYAKLSETDEDGMSFFGNVEGRDVFRGIVDVLVTDAFTGNVFLKTAEGVSAFLLERLRKAFADTTSSSAQEVVKGLSQHVNYDEYPGAVVCGVNGLVIKCHGYSSARAMKNGILGGRRLAKKALIENMNP